MKALYAIYEAKGKVDTKELTKTLRFRSTYGGLERKPEGEAKALRTSVFTSPGGKVTLWSNVEFNSSKQQATVTQFARDTEIGKYLEKLSDLEGIQWARDDSSTSDKYGKLTVQFKPKLKGSQYEKLVAYVDKELSSNENYILNFTERFIDETGQSAAVVMPMSLTSMLESWVKWRIELEQKACAYWIKQDEKEIARLELLMQAVDLVDYIVSLLKNAKLDTDQVYAAYAKKAHVDIEAAKYVLNRPIITLRKLDKATLQAQRKDVQANKTKLEKRKAKPTVFLAEQLKGWAKLEPHA